MSRTRPRRLWWWLAGAGALALLLAVAVPYVYVTYVREDAPETLTAQAGTSVPPATGSVEGAWTVAPGSQAGYRVPEVLGGQDTTAVGRTDDVTGRLTVTDGRVTAGTVTVDLTTVTSDEQRRDRQFHGRIMQTATYPEATFTLTEPAALGALASGAGTGSVRATGTLALHGVTKPVTVDLQTVRSGDEVRISGQIPVAFADYGIDNPSFGDFAKVGDSGAVELLLVLTRA